MSAEVVELRRAVGRAADLWAPGGCHALTDGWRAFSHADAVDYNVFCGWGDRSARDGMDAIAEAGVKGIVMLAGAAAERVAELEESHWRRIGDTPLMTRRLTSNDVMSDVELIDRGTIDEARALVVGAFGVPEALAAVALPESAVTASDRFVVGLRKNGALVCTVGAVITGEVVVSWSMATDPAHLRRGYGRLTFEGMLAHGAGAGARLAAHISSPTGEPLYTKLGFRVRERWTMWSRPRWTFGRT